MEAGNHEQKMFSIKISPNFTEIREFKETKLLLYVFTAICGIVVLDGLLWYCMAYDGIVWPYIVLYGLLWYYGPFMTTYRFELVRSFLAVIICSC